MQRNLTGVAGIILSLVAFGTSAYHIYTGFFGQPEAYLHRVIHVTLMMLITFMSYSAFSRADDGKVPWYDVVVIGLWFVTMGYLFYEYDWIIEHIGYTEEFAPFQVILAFGAVALTLEACRRAIGWPLAALALLIFLFAFTGPYLPGFLGHLGYTASEVADNLYFLTDGLFGLPTHISANFIFLFIVFGAFLEKSGFGLFTIEFATALAGRFRGGPAKIAVVASGLMGSISGSSTANAVITGSFSIPMMKKIGFKNYMAGAVEAAASTGGLIMPPVMASAGFLMSEYTGIPYVNVMQYVLVPAVLYFLAVGIMVHIYAVKENIPTVPREELPSLKKAIMARGHLALPLIILIYLLVAGFSPGYAVVRCIVGIVIVSWLRKATRMGLRDIWDALVQGGIQSTVVAVAIITSGIMVGIFDLTGVAIKFSGVIVDLAGGQLLVALIFVMITAIVLGMGLPLSSAYIVQVGIAIPALVVMLRSLGLDPVAIVPQAHLFVIFFCAISAITPPTAPTSYAAAAIAQAPVVATSVEAVKLALPAFVLPYAFVANSALLTIGTAAEVTVTVFFAVCSMVAMGMAVQGYCFRNLDPITRLLLLAVSLGMITPWVQWNLVSLVLGAAWTAWEWYRSQPRVAADG